MSHYGLEVLVAIVREVTTNRVHAYAKQCIVRSFNLLICHILGACPASRLLLDLREVHFLSE